MRLESGKVVDFNELGNTVHEHLGLFIDPGYLELNNYSYFTVYVSQDDDKDENNRVDKLVKEYEETGTMKVESYSAVTACMNLLNKKGLIDAGRYIVLVSW